MEDFGFVSGTFKSKAGTEKANEELNKVKKAHYKNLKKCAKDKTRMKANWHGVICTVQSQGQVWRLEGIQNLGKKGIYKGQMMQR